MSYDNSTTILEYLRKIIYNYVEIDESTAIIVLNYNAGVSPLESRYRNYTSDLIKKLLSNTRSGSAQRQFGITFTSFISGVLVSIVFCLTQVLLFSLLRNKLDFIYQPNVKLYHRSFKSDSVPTEPLAEKLENHLWSWIRPTWNASIEDYRDYGLDAYFFLRFLKTLSMFFFILSIVIIPILIPIHYISGYKPTDIHDYITDMKLSENVSQEMMISHLPYGLTGLDKISMSNISPAHSNRLVFHLGLAVLLVCFFHHFLLRELKFYVSERNKTLVLGSGHWRSHQNVLFIGNTDKDFNKNKIERFCESLIPGCVHQIVQLPENWEVSKQRNKNIYRLSHKIERTQLDIIITKLHFGASDVFTDLGSSDIEKKDSSIVLTSDHFPYFYKDDNLKSERYNACQFSLRKAFFIFKETLNGSIFSGFYLNRKDNAKWYTASVVGWSAQLLIKKKQLKLDKCFKKLDNLLQEQDFFKANQKDCSKQSFIIFKKVCFAHMFDQMILSEGKSEMSDDKSLGINPEDIIWCNIHSINRTWRLIRVAVSNFLDVTIIIGWVVPVAAVGFISQIPVITKIIPIVANIKMLPEIISKPIGSIVPAVTLIFLTEGVPVFFRWFSVLKCSRSGAQVEMDVQKWFFAFLFVHIFLVVTISSGISVIIETVVNSPINIPHLLGTNLPKCSNFFCSFVLIRGIAYFGGNLLQLKNLMFYLLYYKWHNKTPREKLEYWLDLPNYQWGSLYPIFSVLASITIIYSVISPFVLPLASFAFIFVMFSFKYSLKYQFNHINQSETVGQFYPQALMQLYSGVYFLEACLIGLFALSNCFKLSLFMFIFMIFTISAHFQISNFSRSVIKYLPASMASDESDDREENFQLNQLQPRVQKMWIPRDSKGIAISEAQVWQLKYRVEFSHNSAYINKCGTVVVASNP